jgi:glycosyltransferase involved in cell wall biosynthesis
MRVGFDVTPLRVPQSGVGTYTQNLLSHLRDSTGDEIVLMEPNRPGWKAHSVLSRTPMLNKTVWMQAVLPWVLPQLGLQLCHFTNSVAPVWAPIPTVVTIHDMTLWLFPEHHYRRRLLAMRPLIPLAARHAAAVIAVSHSAKADIVRILDIPEQKVRVVYEAAAPAFHPLSNSNYLEEIRRQYRLPDPFVLYVGTIEPRKNLIRLLDAFARLRKSAAIPHSLVLVGGRGWKDAAIFAAMEKLEREGIARYLGRVPMEVLVGIFNLADALVFPSLYEGFGLPVVEAMACGTPVVTSPNGSLREVAGDAAEFVEPTNVESIEQGMRRVLTDPDRQADLRVRGLAQAKSFSWAIAAAETRQLYAEVLARSMALRLAAGCDHA